MMNSNYIKGQWSKAQGKPFISIEPATEQTIWLGHCTTPDNVQQAVDCAKQALATWRKTSLQQRIQVLQKFNDIVSQRQHELANLISRETGKPLWDASKEVQAVLGKLPISIRAYEQRSGDSENPMASFSMTLHHRAHGVMAIFGPYNFPCHLPNGHIMPALLAGNTVVFKPSELTPACGEFMAQCWHDSGLPAGVFNLIQGAKETGQALSAADGVAGVLFTGSEKTGRSLHKQFAGRPEIMLALEMGGNNPLIIEQNTRMSESILLTLESAFISSGQRCTCARRIFVPVGEWGDLFIKQLITLTTALPIDSPDSATSPFMGCMISAQAADNLLAQQQQLIALGAKVLIPCGRLALGKAFITAGIIDVSQISPLPDEEIFGPLLQVIRYGDFTQAIEQANQSRFGLSAGLISENHQSFKQFQADIHAGIINWNRPLTGASSALPFGGIGASGNHRPSAFYAADYCSFPVSGLQQHSIDNDSVLTRYFSNQL